MPPREVEADDIRQIAGELARDECGRVWRMLSFRSGWRIGEKEKR